MLTMPSVDRYLSGRPVKRGTALRVEVALRALDLRDQIRPTTRPARAH